MKHTAVKVLLIEDNPGDARLIKEMLRDARGRRFEIEHTETLGEAFEHLSENRYDALILDLELPDSNGIETFLKLRAREEDTPILVLTGFSDELLATNAMQEGAQDYLIKGEVEANLLSRSILYSIERKRTERALRESEQRYHLLFNQSPDGVVIIDPETFMFLDFNDTACRRLGYSREEFSHLRIGDLELMETPDEIQLHTGKIMREGRDDFETMHRAKNGEIRDMLVSAIRIEFSGRMVVYSIFRDITEMKKAEAERMRLVAAIEQAAEGILISKTDWTIEYANPAFERISGYSRGEILGKHPRMFMSGKHDLDFYRAMRDTLDRGDVWTGRFTSKRQDGAFYETDTTISPVRDHKGRIINFVTVERDITNEVRLEKQLHQAQKMEALGTLAGGISHDFNNILGIIMGYAEMARLNHPEIPSLSDQVDQVLKAAHRAKDLISQILAFCRQSEQERKPMQVGFIIQETLKMLRASIPSTIDISHRIESKGVILADPSQIHQILMNLCTNAAHAMSEKGGILQLCLTDVEIGEPVPSPGMLPGSYVKLTVSDTGHGMAEDVMERIFDPFFTTKAFGEGTGMGLSVVHGIVKSHGGAVTVYSEPGAGSAFNIYLPKIDSSSSPESRTPSVLQTGKGRILLVDDEKALLAIGRQALEHLGYEVVSRSNGLEALEAFRAQPGSFDLIITDQTMPQMTGEQLAHELTAIRPGIPIILCTGFSEAMMRQKRKETAIAEFMQKPIILSDLAAAVGRALGRVNDPK